MRHFASELSRPRSAKDTGDLMVSTVRATSAKYNGSPHWEVWTPEYAGAPNPGPGFVRGELHKVGHTGSITLVPGDSRKTVPAFLREHPDLYFDLITIDGGKSVVGAASDFANALPRLKVGGIVVSDDICLAPHLTRVWDYVIRRDMRYVSWRLTEGAAGVAAAVRMSDDPVLTSLFEPN